MFALHEAFGGETTRDAVIRPKHSQSKGASSNCESSVQSSASLAVPPLKGSCSRNIHISYGFLLIFRRTGVENGVPRAAPEFCVTPLGAP